MNACDVLAVEFGCAVGSGWFGVNWMGPVLLHQILLNVVCNHEQSWLGTLQNPHPPPLREF